MADKTWKQIERKVATVLGGHRIPITGRQRGDVPDVSHDLLAIEVKDRKTLPAWLHDGMAQAEAAAAGTEKTPLLILHARGQAIGESFAVVRLAEWIALHGPVKEIF